LTGSGSSNNASAIRNEKFCANYLRKSLIGAIKLTEYPRATIFLKLTVLHDDGAVLACSLNAASLALLDAGILMSYVPAAISVVVAGPSGGRESAGVAASESLLLDPTASEESSAEAICTYTMQSSIVQKNTSSHAPSILNTHTSGCVTADDISATLEMATKAVALVHDFMRKTIEHKVAPKGQEHDDST
jgi:ribonuclease PH